MKPKHVLLVDDKHKDVLLAAQVVCLLCAFALPLIALTEFLILPWARTLHLCHCQHQASGERR